MRIGCLPEKPEPSTCINIIMLNLEVCRRILNRNEEKYSDEQVLQIRDLLLLYSKIHIDSLKVFRNEKESNHLYQGVNGRTS